MPKRTNNPLKKWSRTLTSSGFMLNRIARYTSGDVGGVVKYKVRGKLFGMSNRGRNKYIK